MEPGHHFKSAITIAALAIIPHNDKHKALQYNVICICFAAVQYCMKLNARGECSMSILLMYLCLSFASQLLMAYNVCTLVNGTRPPF